MTLHAMILRTLCLQGMLPVGCNLNPQLRAGHRALIHDCALLERERELSR